MKNMLKEFREVNHLKFYDILIRKEIFKHDEAEAISYGLQDISESIEEIYYKIIPKILENPNASKEYILDLVWDIREQFRHIQYHIDDGDLTNL